MNSLRKIHALVIKEFYQIIRDPSSWLISVFFPFFLLFIYAVGISLDMKDLKIGVVLEEMNSDAQSFYLAMRNSPFLDPKLYKHTNDFQDEITSGKLHGYVNLPFYFSEYEKQTAEKGPLYVVADGSDPNTANFVQNYVMGAWSKWIIQENISTKSPRLANIDIEQRFWFNESLESRNFILPGAIAIIMTLIGSLLTALVIAREWERGSIESLMAMPISIWEIYLAKLISYFFMGMISMVICAFFSIVVFNVPFVGSYLMLVIVSSTFLLTALGTGLLISSLTRSQFLAAQISIVSSFLPAFMLSGFIFEISSMPKFIQWLTYLMPARYMVSSMQTLFLAGNVLRLLFINIGIMLFIITILFAIILLTTRKRLD
ncbi:MAG TPA: ABC transporter permease [Chlamydiales bacterium]|nr:ABC transporter permease [Chlamydiales bacterium]